MQYTQKTISEMEKVACLIDHPKKIEFQANIGTGFFIQLDTNSEVFYFVMTNHNLNNHLYEKIKVGDKYVQPVNLYGDSSNLNPYDVAKKLDDFFIYCPHYDLNGKLEWTFSLPPLYIESIIIPKNRYLKDGITQDTTTDFCFFKINLSVEIQDECVPSPDTIKPLIKELCYSDFNFLNEKLKRYNNIKFHSNIDFVQNQIIQKNQLVTFTGFPINKSDFNYDENGNTLKFEYSTIFAEIQNISNELIDITNQRKKNGEISTDKIDDMNGLSGSPLLHRIEFKETPESKPFDEFHIVIGMFIAGTAAISINHLQNVLNDKTKITEISNPNFGKLIVEQSI